MVVPTQTLQICVQICMSSSDSCNILLRHTGIAHSMAHNKTGPAITIARKLVLMMHFASSVDPNSHISLLYPSLHQRLQFEHAFLPPKREYLPLGQAKQFVASEQTQNVRHDSFLHFSARQSLTNISTCSFRCILQHQHTHLRILHMQFRASL